jgi:hypothetical protein
MSKIAQILQSYRISTSSDEILNVLQKNTQDTCIMWQTFPSHRTIFTFHEYKIDLKTNKILIPADVTNEKLNSKLPVYVKIPFRETVFKGSVLNIKESEISLAIPNEVQMRDFRENLRSSFIPGEKFVDIKTSVGGVSSLKVSLKDISQSGIGLMVSENNIHLFQSGQTLELCGVNDDVLRIPLIGTVVYTSKQPKINSAKGFFYRVGIKMFSLIPEIVINKLNRKLTVEPEKLSSRLLASDILSDEFKEMMSREVSRTLEKLKKRPAIMKYLHQLEVIRGNDDYIEEHIKVLTIICTFIARSMGWVSEASLEKFVYASYMHDAPLFQHPKLARIRDLQEFEKMKALLTPEEQKIFLSAPETSAAIVSSDYAAPIDAEMMMIQQKERPDGSGFPHRFSVTKIAPLAAVFIIAHDLTDVIMMEQDWAMDKWLIERRKLFKGSHFSKIMDSLESVKVTFKKSSR